MKVLQLIVIGAMLSLLTACGGSKLALKQNLYEKKQSILVIKNKHAIQHVGTQAPGEFESHPKLDRVVDAFVKQLKQSLDGNRILVMNEDVPVAERKKYAGWAVFYVSTKELYMTSASNSLKPSLSASIDGYEINASGAIVGMSGALMTNIFAEVEGKSFTSSATASLEDMKKKFRTVNQTDAMFDSLAAAVTTNTESFMNEVKNAKE